MKWASLALALVTGFTAFAQQPSAASPPAQATVRYTFDWPQGIPWRHYVIAVQANGATHFEGTPNPEDNNNDPDTVKQDFMMSEANRQKIFTLARESNYFRGPVESNVKHIAQTGKKTLEYHSPEAQGSATYNWSADPDIQQLTNLFGAIATTIDYGQKLAFQYRFDKLGMDLRIKALSELQASHSVEELAIIAPMLRKIADDPNLMNMDRQRAHRLLEGISLPATAQAPGQL